MKLTVFGFHDGAAIQAQRGSVVIIVAAVLAILGTMLVSVQMGYDYLQEQRLQKAADLAALSAVQVLGETTCDSRVSAIAAGIASENGSGVSVAGVECGRWAGQPTPVFVVSSVGTPEQPLNAVRVRVTTPAVSLLPALFSTGESGSSSSATTLSVTSIAVIGPPVATFSVGAKLLSLGPDGLVGNILKPVGLDVSEVAVLSSEGLAKVNVTPSGLLGVLGLPTTVLAGVGTDNELLKLHSLTLGNLLDAYGNVLAQATPADVDLSLLDSAFQKIKASSLNVPISLLGANGIIANLTAAGASGLASTLPSALSTKIGLADLIGSSILAANGKNFVDLKTSLQVVEGSSSLFELGLVSLAAQVVTQPTIVTGPVGATASNVQTQFSLGLDLVRIPGLISSSLPVTLGVSNSTAKLEAITMKDDTATFSNSGTATARLCIGKLDAGEVCGVGSTPDLVDFVKLKLLFLPVLTLQVGGNIPLVACENCGNPVTVKVGEDGWIKTSEADPKTAIVETDLQTNAKVLGLVNIKLGEVLSPLLTLLNAILAPLLQKVVVPLLGADLNQTNIHLYSITRGAPYLVQ